MNRNKLFLKKFRTNEDTESLFESAMFIEIT